MAVSERRVEAYCSDVLAAEPSKEAVDGRSAEASLDVEVMPVEAGHAGVFEAVG